MYNTRGMTKGGQTSPLNLNINFPRKAVIGAILVVALLAFEIFNFDTTRYALQNLLGDAAFLGLRWASILAIAFCAIDFAGLARLFTPEQGSDEPKAVWYLMGAWLLGATMNAIMTWWAVSVTLLSHEFGNEVMGREDLLFFVPIFIAILVWLTRILFIGAFSVAGEHIFDLAGNSTNVPAALPQPQTQPQRTTAVAPQKTQALPHPQRKPIRQQPSQAPTQVRHRPPVARPRPVAMSAKSRNR